MEAGQVRVIRYGYMSLLGVFSNEKRLYLH
jgi:hypothetical protein